MGGSGTDGVVDPGGRVGDHQPVTALGLAPQGGSAARSTSVRSLDQVESATPMLTVNRG